MLGKIATVLASLGAALTLLGKILAGALDPLTGIPLVIAALGPALAVVHADAAVAAHVEEAHAVNPPRSSGASGRVSIGALVSIAVVLALASAALAGHALDAALGVAMGLAVVVAVRTRPGAALAVACLLPLTGCLSADAKTGIAKLDHDLPILLARSQPSPEQNPGKWAEACAAVIREARAADLAANGAPVTASAQ